MSTSSGSSSGGIGFVAWYDEKAERKRLVIGYVGEDGIAAGVWYRAKAGKLVVIGGEQ